MVYLNNKRGKVRIIKVMKLDKLSSPETIVNSFADYFKTLYLPSTSKTDPSEIHQIDEGTALNILRKAKNSFTTGAVNLPSFLLCQF